MVCPTCSDTHLVMAERQGIEIDYCPKCRGVWLDKGELDKIIERASTQQAETYQQGQQQKPPQTQQMPSQQPYQQQPYQQQHYNQHKHDEHYYHKKKHKSFWGEVFDFD